LTHIAQKKSLTHPERRTFFDQALIECLDMDLRLVEPDHKSVLRLALDTGLASYDACYLYIARMLGVPLLTFDERLKRAARG
jgi:predicted nucleic acid-binding protein